MTQQIESVKIKIHHSVYPAEFFYQGYENEIVFFTKGTWTQSYERS